MNCSVTGSDDGGTYSSALQLNGPICDTGDIVTYHTPYNYVYVHINIKDDVYISKHGVVAGYVTYTG